ncbi:Defensin-like protein 141 [Arabidopsis thaliana]
MTKSIISAFFIILILGMMVNEIEGQQQQQRCEEALTEIDCGAGNCNALCLQKRKGLGRCVQRTPCDKLKMHVLLSL